MMKRPTYHRIHLLLVEGWFMKAPALSLLGALAFMLLGAPLAAQQGFTIFERPFEELGRGQSSD